MIGKLIRALVPFVAAIAAVLLLRNPDLWLRLFLPVLLIPAASGAATYLAAKSWPRLAARIVGGWALMPLCLLTLSSFAVIWLTLNGLKQLGGKLSSDESAAYSAALVGAATTFFGALWVTEVAEEDSRFWPGPFLRAVWGKAFAGHPSLDEPRSPAAEDAFAAIYEDEAGAVVGWGAEARAARADAVQRWLDEVNRGT